MAAQLFILITKQWENNTDCGICIDLALLFRALQAFRKPVRAAVASREDKLKTLSINQHDTGY